LLWNHRLFFTAYRAFWDLCPTATEVGKYLGLSKSGVSRGKRVRPILLTPMNLWAWGSGPESYILLFLQLFILMDLPFRLFAGTGHRRRKNAIQQVSRVL